MLAGCKRLLFDGTAKNVCFFIVANQILECSISLMMSHLTESQVSSASFGNQLEMADVRNKRTRCGLCVYPSDIAENFFSAVIYDRVKNIHPKFILKYIASRGRFEATAWV